MPDTNLPMPEMKRNDGGPVYPQEYNWPEDMSHLRGITLRDHFAGKALTVFVQSAVGASNEALGKAMRQSGASNIWELAAKEAYGYADAMLMERDK
jgi:hypothetical protein